MKNENLAMNFWGRVEQLQMTSNKTLKSICKECQIPYQTIINQKTSARLPNLLEAISIAKALRTTVEWLMYGTNQLSDFTKTEEVISKLASDSRLQTIMKRTTELSQTELFALEVLLKIR